MVRSEILMSVQGFTPSFKQLIEIGKAKSNLTESDKTGFIKFVKFLTKSKSSEILISEEKIEVFGKSAHHLYYYHNTGIMRITPSQSMNTEVKKKFYPFN